MDPSEVAVEKFVGLPGFILCRFRPEAQRERATGRTEIVRAKGPGSARQFWLGFFPPGPHMGLGSPSRGPEAVLSSLEALGLSIEAKCFGLGLRTESRLCRRLDVITSIPRAGRSFGL